MLRQMWKKLDAYTLYVKSGLPRKVNERNEWGGFSKRLNMAVFTGWQDHASKGSGPNQMIVSDTTWKSISGIRNQEHWVSHAIDNDVEAGYFLIKAVDRNESPRRVEWLDDSRILCGKIIRVGTQAIIFPTHDISL